MIVKHPTRRYYTDSHADHGNNVMLISLPAIPGVSYAFDRADTAPTQPTIRAHRRKPQGVAKDALAARKVDEIAAAILAARSAVLPPVTVAMEVGE